MDYQIILLPRQDYWAWLRACKDYVLAFGANLTPEPTTAANYMAPRQAITFPAVPDGYPEHGDLETWFAANCPGIRLDPIPVSTPDELREVLRTRLEAQDRYGQRNRPFYLLWPTDYAVITQRFGANPHIYHRYGMPGHEGLDFRALTNTNIYACAEGTVYELHTNPHDHPYGIHVRLQHADGYKTVYCHLRKAQVSVGEVVTTGQVVGKADSTGNSSGAHLHLTLKRDGATERGETTYPKDILDPTPFLVWPDQVGGKSLTDYDWPAGKCLVGVHGRIGGGLEEADLLALAQARPEAVKLSMGETKETIDRLRASNPGMFLMARLTADFSGEAVPASGFLAMAEPEVGRLYRLGLRYFEVHANPNLQVEGWQRSWAGGGEFAAWFREVVESLRGSYPEARFGFPGLSAGGLIPGQREDAMHFLQETDEVIQSADWLGVNCFWTDVAGMNALSGGLLVEEYRLRYPDKLLFVTEFSNPSAAPDPDKAQQYLEYYRMLRGTPGVGAAFGYALSARTGHDPVVWRRGSTDTGSISSLIGGRSF
jgi:murein DD-endopeptidase MepM/ murein hydrolase activator NlpD